MVFNDLTIEDALALIDDDRREVDVRFGSPQYMDFANSPLKDVTLTVTGTETKNYLSNPSFEEGLVGWKDMYASPVSDKMLIDDRAREGSKCVYLRQDAGYMGQFGQTLDFVSDGTPLYVMLSMTSDIDTGKDLRIALKYSVDGVEESKFFFYYTSGLGGKDSRPGLITRPGWVDTYWVYTPPEGANITGFVVEVPQGHEVYIDRLALSNQPIWVPETTGSGNVSFMFGDRLIEAGELASGESKTISLPSDVWLDGLVPIVPVTGLAYTVSIDGTPVSEGEQSIRETKKLLEQTIPLIIGLAVIGGLITMLGRLKF